VPETAIQLSAPSPQEKILGIVNNYWQGCCVGAAAQLEIADLLADGPLPVDVLAQRTKTHAPSLFRMLRALESIGIFTQSAPGVFANTAQSDCLRRHKEGSQWAWVRITLCPDSFPVDGWRGLMLSLQNGRTGVEQIRGRTGWELLQDDPEQSAYFNAAMRDLSAAMTPAVTAAYDWSRFPGIADIGGGIGAQLSSILDAHPSCRGILFDQSHVIADAPPNGRIERIGGDFFAGIPVQADAYLMRWVIHDWADPEALTILGNIKKVAAPGARVVLVEWVLTDTPEPDTGKWMDVNMLVNAGGKERSAGEFRELDERAGFELEAIVPTASPLHIIVGRPRA
jgi:hypothetical protein